MRIICAMDQHQDDALVQTIACSALWFLAVNNANHVTLMAAGVHVRIIRAMDRHQDDARVQEKACDALWNLAANNAYMVTLVAAEAHVRIFARWTGTGTTRKCKRRPAARSGTSRSTTPTT